MSSDKHRNDQAGTVKTILTKSILSARCRYQESESDEEDESTLARLLYEWSLRRPSSSAQTSFDNFYDYIATIAVGEHKLQEERRKAETAPIESCDLKLLKVAADNENEFNAFFRTPPEYHGQIQPGGRALVYLTMDGRKGGPWDMRVIEPPQCARRGEITAVLTRKWDLRCGRWSDARKVVTITPPGQHAKGGAELAWIHKQKGIKAQIEPEYRHSLWVYINKAADTLLTRSCQSSIGELERSALDLLIGKFSNLPNYNIYSTLHNESLASETLMELNHGQKQAIRMAKNAPGGFVICHGGPGTGKTHFILQAVTPFLMDSAKSHRLLLTAATNRGVDSMASALSDRLKHLSLVSPALSSRYILRAHSYKTEKAIVMRHAENARRQKLSRKSTAPTQSVANSSLEVEVTVPSSSIFAHCSTFSSSKFELVDDSRVQNIDLSIGQKVLELQGLTSPRSPNQSDMPGRNVEFVSLYEKYRQGVSFTEEQEEELEETLDEVLGAAIQGATALCATIGGAAEDKISKHYSHAELIVMDEAARMPEFETWTLFAFYPKAIGKIMVGDHKQLGPHLEEYSEVKPYLPQLRMSLQERCSKANFPSAFFAVQYRATSQIADVCSRVCYGKRLLHDKTTRLDHQSRGLSRDVVAHNQQKYHLANSVAFFDIPMAQESSAYGTSKTCEDYAAAVMNILEGLLLAGFGTDTKPCTIAILTPYSGQFKVLRIAKDKMQNSYPEAQNVIIETVGKCQGMQYDIVIADPVLVDTKPTFLTSKRLNVMLSRARHGLYVVGCYDEWIDMRWQDAGALQAFAEELFQYRVPWPHGNNLQSRFIDPEVFTYE
ncbi:hypothetical protein RBB50_007905 [Rhinocladiella similis]